MKITSNSDITVEDLRKCFELRHPIPFGVSLSRNGEYVWSISGHEGTAINYNRQWLSYVEGATDLSRMWV